ncbi:hypothetical protein Plhal703r1_c03g0015591 [Plasmopara halstedii]
MCHIATRGILLYLESIVGVSIVGFHARQHRYQPSGPNPDHLSVSRYITYG